MKKAKKKTSGPSCPLCLKEYKPGQEEEFARACRSEGGPCSSLPRPSKGLLSRASLGVDTKSPMTDRSGYDEALNKDAVSKYQLLLNFD